MKSTDINVEVKGTNITISGERKEEHHEESADKKSYRMERSFGQVGVQLSSPSCFSSS